MTSPSTRASRVLVTGAAGFVGTALCSHLRSRGYDVIAAARGEHPGCTAVGDFAMADWDGMLASQSRADRPPDNIDRNAAKGGERSAGVTTQGVDAIVHLAALAHRRAGVGETDYLRTNVEVTRRLVEAAKRQRVRRLVFVSSVKVNGEQSHGRAFTDSDPAHPEDAYARSKWAAEQAVGAASSSFETVILRPPLVYGPGVRANFLSLLRIVERGWPLPLASVRNQRSLLALDNLVSAIECSLEHPALAGGTFLLADGEDFSTPELVRRIARAMGRRAHLFPCPPGMLALAAGCVGRRDAARALLGSLRIDVRRFRALAGWTAPCSPDRGIDETVAWYRRSHSPSGGQRHASV